MNFDPESLDTLSRVKPNAQAQRRAAGMPHSEGTLSSRLHPSALSEAAPRVRCSLLLEGASVTWMPSSQAFDGGARWR